MELVCRWLIGKSWQMPKIQQLRKSKLMQEEHDNVRDTSIYLSELVCTAGQQYGVQCSMQQISVYKERMGVFVTCLQETVDFFLVDYMLYKYIHLMTTGTVNFNMFSSCHFLHPNLLYRIFQSHFFEIKISCCRLSLRVLY